MPKKKLQYIKALERSIESILIHWELVYPRIYAVLISIGLMILAAIVSYGFYIANQIVGVSVAVVNLFLVMVISWFVNVFVDLVIVNLASDIRKNKIPNIGIAADVCKGFFTKYLFALVPIGVVRSIAVFAVVWPILLSSFLTYFTLGVTYGTESADVVSSISRSAIRFITTAVELIFQFLFVFVAQIVLFEKFGVIDTLKRSLRIAFSRPKDIAFYILFRYVSGAFFGIILVLATFLLLLIGGGFSLLIYSVGYTTASYVLAGLSLVIGILGAVIGALAISSGLLVLDTDLYFQLRK